MIPQIQRRALRLAKPQRFDNLVAALDPLIWLSLREASGGISFNRVFTSYGPDNPGPELLSNNDFSAWTGTAPDDQPDGWAVAESPPDYYVTQDPAGECRLIETSGFAILRQTVLVKGDSYRSSLDVTDLASGRVRYAPEGSTPSALADAVATFSADRVAPGTTFYVVGQTSNDDVTFDNVSCRKIGEADAALSGGISLGQSGLLGGTHAYAIDGSTGVGTIYNRASIQGMSAFTLSQLIKPDTLTDGDYLWFKADEIEVWLNNDGSIFARAHYSTTDAETTSAAGVLSAGAWALVHVVLDSSDKTLYLYVNDALVNDSVQAGAGSRVSNTNNLLLWKNASSNGFDGLADEVFLKPSATSAADLAAIAQSLTGLG